MLSFALRTVILVEDCFQLGRLFCGNNRTSFYLSIVTDDILRIAFVTFDGYDILKVLGSLLTILACSNCDCFHRTRSHRDNAPLRAGDD